jgi:serine/threonine protein kinase/tetratricopeptide (TPR) repeat protein
MSDLPAWSRFLGFPPDESSLNYALLAEARERTMPANLQKARELFLHAVGKLPPEGWQTFVAAACGGDAELEQQVRHLLQVHLDAGSFLERPAVALAMEGRIACVECPGTVIGPYKLLEQIGEGGFGVVFMAEQQHPVRRKVALKVLKPGMDTKQVVTRFEAERQALALMDHPHIAHVLDAGATDTGRPYFVMELIRGIHITQFCDDNQRTPRERLELFITVCQAVQHAHQKGIIHRDLKPSNVLVTLLDGRPVVKVIDFGIAKALGQERLTDKTLFTGFVQMMGTPLYMSPEQAEMSGRDVDTRTDIYALGVLLYELLTGTTPFDKDRLKAASYDEIRSIIRQEEPAKPSTRISTLGHAATMVSANRKSEPRRLRQLFRGELDWIVMKALEKDRNRRYETASSFSTDVQRYLDDESVQACPPTLARRAAKWSRRHRSVVWAVVLLLVVAFIASAVATLLVARERDAANANYQIAKENLDIAYEILSHSVATAEKRLTRAKELTQEDRRVLEETLAFYVRIAHQNSRDPSVRLRTTEAYRQVASIHELLGQPEQALAAYKEGLVVSSKLASEAPHDPAYRQNLARSYASLGGVYETSLRSGRRSEVEQAYAEALRIQEQLIHEFPADLGYQHDLGLTYNRLGYMRLYGDTAKGGAALLAEAEWPVRRALEIRQKLVVAKPEEFIYRQELGGSLGNYGDLLMMTGQFQEAETVVGRELEVRQQLVDEFPTARDARDFLADAYVSLAGLRSSSGKFQEAAEAFRQELVLRKAFAAEFPGIWPYQTIVARSHITLGDALHRTSAQDESMAAYKDAIAVCTEIIGRHPECADAYIFWGEALARTGARKEAVAAWEKVLQHGRDKAEAANFVARSIALSLDLRMQNREEAVHLTRAVDLARKAVELAPENGWYWNTLGAAYLRTGQWTDAVAALDKSMQLRSGGDSADWLLLAMAHCRLGEREKARMWYGRAVPWMAKYKPYDQELSRLRAEAVVLLGIQEEPLKKQSAIGKQRSAHKASMPQSGN